MTGPSSGEVVELCSKVANSEGLVVTKSGSYGGMIIEKAKAVGQVIYDLGAGLWENLANRVKRIFEMERLAELTAKVLVSIVLGDGRLRHRVVAAIKSFFIQELGGAMIGY